MTKIFEVKLVPQSPDATIKFLIVRVDNPDIDDVDKCVLFLDGQFPDYNIETVIAGYKSDYPVQ